jgi:hypothetical protein
MTTDDGGVNVLVTAELLGELGACKDYRDLFLEKFGKEPIAVTAELCERYHGDFLWFWAAEKLLTREGRDDFCPTFSNPQVECTCPYDDSRMMARRFGEIAVRYGIVTLEQVRAARGRRWST